MTNIYICHFVIYVISTVISVQQFSSLTINKLSIKTHAAHSYIWKSCVCNF